jgi:hypothetical protein
MVALGSISNRENEPDVIYTILPCHPLTPNRLPQLALNGHSSLCGFMSAIGGKADKLGVGLS